MSPPPWAPLAARTIITVDANKDYKGFDNHVYAFLPIIFDTLLSGQKDPEARAQATLILGDEAHREVSFFGAMQDYCKQIHPEGGWQAEPVEFRLTGLEFYPTRRSGGMADDPRSAKAKIPILIQGKNGPEKIENEADASLAHFYINGFWVFKCTNGKAEEMYAIPTESEVHTWVHAPYDKAFADAFEQSKSKAAKEGTILAIGRPYDREATGMSETSMQKICNVSQYLKVLPGDKGVDLKIVKLSDIYKGFKFSP